jgi:hypothetical protein
LRAVKRTGGTAAAVEKGEKGVENEREWSMHRTRTDTIKPVRERCKDGVG